MNTPKASGAARLRAASRLRRDMASVLPPKPIASAMEAVQQAEELQRHGDHEQPGDDRENSLGGVERTVQQRRPPSPCARADDLAERAGERAEEAVGRQSAGIVEQVAHDGRASPARIAAQRAGKAAAHADAVKATLRNRRRRSPGNRSSADCPAHARLDHRRLLLARRYWRTR